MSEQLLQINQIHADIEEKEILHGVSLNINPGETHVLMGPNGAGKSTLGHVLMGNPKYHISSGNIIFKGNDITGESTDKRARDGIFLSFQEPLEVPGLSLESFIRSAIRQKTGRPIRVWEFHKELKKAMDVLGWQPKYTRVEDIIATAWKWHSTHPNGYDV